jgi:polysaccharide pyruvyl transferase WcaK-like protein
MTTILLVNAAIHNLGDHAIQLIVGSHLERQGIKIECLNMGKEPGYFNEHMPESKIASRVIIPHQLIQLRTRFPDIQHLKLRNYSAIIFIGGGYLNDDSSSFSNLSNYIFIAREAKRQGIPYFFTGQSIGPLNASKSQKTVFKMLKDAAGIYVREKFSADLLSTQKIRHMLTADDVLLDANVQYSRTKDQKVNNPYIIIGLKGYKAFSTYNQKLKGLLEEILPKLQQDVYIIPFNKNQNSSDYAINMELYDSLKEHCPIHFVMPGELQGFEQLIKKSSLVLSNAYHGVVFACMYGVPVLTGFEGAYYQQKILGALDVFGANFDESIINVNLDSTRLLAQIETRIYANTIYNNEKAEEVQSSWHSIIKSL